MAITLNHLIVPAHDKATSAKFVADILGLKVGWKSPGNAPKDYFAVVPVGFTISVLARRDNLVRPVFEIHPR